MSPGAGTQAYAGPHSQFLKSLKPLPEVRLKPAPHLMGPEEVESGPLLVSLDGLAGVSVLSADGKVRIARAGDALEMGDSFQTGEKGNARVAFEKGVQVLCPPGVILHLDQVSVAGPAGGIDVPMVELEQGEVRVLVEGNASVPADAEKAPPKPLKLVLRTKAAVMGVRGTDFLVTATDDKADLRMVSGTVEVAQDERGLGLGQVVRADPGEQAEIVHGRPLPKPEHYEAGMELHDFYDRHTMLEEMWNAAVRDAKAHRFNSRFLEIRQRKADVLNLQNGYPPAAVRAEAARLEEEDRKRKLLKAGEQDEKGGVPGVTPGKKRRRRRGHKKAVPVPSDDDALDGSK